LATGRLTGEGRLTPPPPGLFRCVSRLRVFNKPRRPPPSRFSLGWTRRGSPNPPPIGPKPGRGKRAYFRAPGRHLQTGERNSRQPKILPLSTGRCPAEQARKRALTSPQPEGPRANWITSRLFRRSPCCWPVHRRLNTMTDLDARCSLDETFVGMDVDLPRISHDSCSAGPESLCAHQDTQVYQGAISSG
jgi:hypothetical protein